MSAYGHHRVRLNMIIDAAPAAIYAVGAGGPPVAHVVQFSPAPSGTRGYRPPAEVADCSCGSHFTIDGGHTDAEKKRLARHHAGIEDP